MSQKGKSSGFQRVKRNIFRFVRFALIFFFGSSLFFTLLYRFGNPPITPLMLIRVVENIGDSKKTSISKDCGFIQSINHR